mgnify:CR=1 FL=1
MVFHAPALQDPTPTPGPPPDARRQSAAIRRQTPTPAESPDTYTDVELPLLLRAERLGSLDPATEHSRKYLYPALGSDG